MQINHFPHINHYFFNIPIILFIFFTHLQAWGNARLKVGVSRANPPFSYIDRHNAIPQGFNVSLAKLLAQNMGMTAEIYTMSNSNLIKALNDGTIDLVIGMMYKSYSTQDIYLIETTIKGLETKLFVNNGFSAINSYNDLAGCKVVIEKECNNTLLLPSHININCIEAETMEDALALVNSGDAQAFISNNIFSIQQTIQKNHLKNIKEIGNPLEISPLIIAVNKANSDLLTSVSMAYGKILENGSYYTIYNKWLGSEIGSYMNRYMKYILTGIAISIFTILLFILWNQTLKRRVVLITEEFQNSEKKYRNLIESSPDMIYLISRSGEIRLANKIALNHLGRDGKEITSLRLHDLALPEQAHDLTDFVEEVFENRYSNKKFTLKAKNGNYIQVDIAATIISDSDMIEELVCCFSRDITERMRLEENLLHADRLAIMGRMAAGIAHEINNPLGIILSNTQDVLYNHLNHSDLAESLKLIEISALRTAKIIEDMLNFTRPFELHAAPIDLHHLIDDSLFFLKQKLKQKNITIEKNCPDNLTGFNGDENLIQQLLINIFLNSIQAVKHDGLIRILISETRDNNVKRIILEIEDNGIGIPEKDLQQIFTPFFTSRKENGGFGLGLFIAKMIVEKHNGSLSARSEVGKGTAMKMVFPSFDSNRQEL